jgi:hypothetical protein
MRYDEECKKTVEEKNRAGVKVMQRETRLNEINFKSKRVEAKRIIGGREGFMNWEFSNIGRSKHEEQV